MLRYGKKLWEAIDRDDLLMAALAIKSLQRCGCVDARNTDGETSLMHACEEGKVQIVEALIEAGANVNAKDNKGLTPLMLATWDGHTKVAEILLVAGADINAQNIHGDTASSLAKLEGYTDIVNMLEKIKKVTT